MGISKVKQLTVAAIFVVSFTAQASEQSSDSETSKQSSHWFVGGGVAMDFFSEDNAFTSDGSTDGFDLHVGFQPNKYLKFIAGYKDFGVSDLNINFPLDFTREASLNNYYIKVRPQWVFDSNFLIYAELGLNSLKFKGRNTAFFGGNFAGESVTTTINKSSTNLSWGAGVGYNLGQHEITLGVESYGSLDTEGSGFLIDSSKISSFTLQYNYHF